MAHFDVFNGDADGMCALHQLRLADPRDATLVTGVKRDIALLERVDAGAGDSVTVLDISIDVNRAALLALLERGASVHYFDHHGTGEVPAHPRLHAIIDTAPDVCTGILVDRWLGGTQRVWAVVAAFGDNFAHEAKALAATLGLSATQVGRLRELGECLNYNAYGDSEGDLVMPPAALYAILRHHPDPFTFIAEEPVYRTLGDARRRDMAMAQQLQPLVSGPHGSIVQMPDAAWSRRVRGAYGNLLASADPEKAHAIIVPSLRGGFTVSVRAPLAARHGADRLCRQFPGGGGRPAAAGINHLPANRLPAFIEAFDRAFGGDRNSPR